MTSGSTFDDESGDGEGAVGEGVGSVSALVLDGIGVVGLFCATGSAAICGSGRSSRAMR
jgi:hypothetical protein